MKHRRNRRRNQSRLVSNASLIWHLLLTVEALCREARRLLPRQRLLP